MHTGLILSTAYFPPVQYFTEIKDASEIYIEAHENYSRQSYRNRCNILSCNGILTLSIPVKNIPGTKQLITDTKIDYSTNWQKIHINAIRSAYGKSPFYQFYNEKILNPLENNKYEFLFELNLNIIETVSCILKIYKKINFTTSFETTSPSNIKDCRNSIHPKNDIQIIKPKYIQVFNDRYGFIPNLSIIDLIFNTGPDAMVYLK